MRESGHKVLITGGASGIGLALAKLYVRHDNRVILVGRDATRLAEASAYSPCMTTYTCDISQQTEVEEMVERLTVEHPDISVLVNNAGIQYRASFLDQRQVSWSSVQEEIGINLVAPIGLVSSLLPMLSRQAEAAIVNVTSGLGLVPKKSAPVYCASKAGLHLFTQALRYQLEATQIKVFEIIPPIVDTEMTKGRGRGKILAEQLAEEFWRSYRRNRLEARIGKVKLLMWLHRLAPPLAEALLKNS